MHNAGYRSTLFTCTHHNSSIRCIFEGITEEILEYLGDEPCIGIDCEASGNLINNHYRTL